MQAITTIQNKIDVTNDTLEEIGVHDIPTLYVYNKFDLLEEEINPTYYPNIIVSLLDNNGVSQVLDLVEKESIQGLRSCEITHPI